MSENKSRAYHPTIPMRLTGNFAVHNPPTRYECAIMYGPDPAGINVWADSQSVCGLNATRLCVTLNKQLPDYKLEGEP